MSRRKVTSQNRTFSKQNHPCPNSSLVAASSRRVQGDIDQPDLETEVVQWHSLTLLISSFQLSCHHLWNHLVNQSHVTLQPGSSQKKPCDVLLPLASTQMRSLHFTFFLILTHCRYFTYSYITNCMVQFNIFKLDWNQESFIKLCLCLEYGLECWSKATWF